MEEKKNRCRTERKIPSASIDTEHAMLAFEPSPFSPTFDLLVALMLQLVTDNPTEEVR
jgi:hypothetical protein